MHQVPKYPHYNFINLDLLDTCATTNNVLPIERCSNYSFVRGDISNMDLVHQLREPWHKACTYMVSVCQVAHLMKQHSIETVMHFAAQVRPTIIPLLCTGRLANRQKRWPDQASVEISIKLIVCLHVLCRVT